MSTINMHQAKTELSSLVARAEAGEEIIIARRNKPVVKLVAIVEQSVHRREQDAHAEGFSARKQAEYDLSGLQRAVEKGGEFTIMRDGQAVAKVVPVNGRKLREPGRFAKRRGDLPPDLFEQPLTEDELAAWEGRFSTAAEQ